MRRFLALFAVLILSGVLASAQRHVVTGTVVDDKGEPVPFATISESGTNNATTADDNGSFSISITGNGSLTFSAIGFDPATLIPSGNTVRASLKRNQSQLTEVVVTALGIKRDEKALGYAVSKVDPTSLLQKSEPDLLKNLQGTVPGVDIRTSQGTPGAATRILIRGNSSFGLENQPLIVVDGVPYSNDVVTTTSQTSGGTAYGGGISDLDPNDIASFTVLKGAAAASLYGSRASRGVLVITTKSGSAKKGAKPLNVSYRSSFSIETVASLPDYQNSYGSGSQFLYQNSNGSWGPKFGLGNVYDGSGNVIRPSTSGIDSVPAWGDYLTAYPELFDANGNMAYKAVPGNVRDLFRTSSIIENSISANGGNEHSSFALTASNLMDNGYVENSSYIKNNFGIGGQTSLKGFTIGGNLSYSHSQQVGGYFGNNQVDGASSQFARSLYLARNWDLSLPYQDANGKPLQPNAGNQFDNPHWSSRNNIAKTIEQRIITGVRMSYKVNSWINLAYNFGSNTTMLGRDEITQLLSRAASGLGRIVEDSYTSTDLQSTFVASFNPKIGNNFTLEFKLGNDIYQNTARRQSNTGSQFVVPGIYNLKNTKTQSFDADNRYKHRIVGFFVDATLGYKNLAFLNVAARNDKTSTLPYKNASYYYPGISGSFVWSEAFNIKPSWLDYGKIRAGWAKVGNDAPENNGQDIYNINSNFLGQASTGLNSETIDPNLTPEFTRELETGLDLSLFKRRVDIDFTLYQKSSTNLIYSVRVPSSTGYSSFTTNIGEISNKGVEIGLTVRPIVTNHFSWDIRGVFSQNKNRVIKLVKGLVRSPFGGGVSNGIQTYIEPGYPVGYLYGTKIDRMPDGTPLIDPATGFMILNLTPSYLGDPNPDYKMGITNTFTFKGFTLSCLFDMTKGGAIYSETINSLLGRGVTKDTKDRETLWVIPGVYGDPNTHEPILSGGKTIPNQTRITDNDLFFYAGGADATFAINGADEFSVYDATVYRIRELSIGYDFPNSVISKLGITALRLTLSGRNLWYLAPNVPKYTNFDPEVNSYGASSIQGIEFSAAPTTRRFGVNLNVTF